MATVGFQEPQKPHKSACFALPPDSVDEGDEGDYDLSQRIEDFKNYNPEEVEELRKCIQDVLNEAELTAQERLDKKAVNLIFLSSLIIH
jgi:hypothetical protein